jgi:diamine N-acetyltransferase
VLLVKVDSGTPYLVRFMVDVTRQRQGVGRQAVALLVDELRAAGWAMLETTFVPVAGGAEGFWRRCGFSDTGRVHDGEPVFARALG